MEVLLDEVCGYLRNFFVTNRTDYHRGKFEVTESGIDCAFLQNGQYFKVQGSVFNDGVWRYPADGMTEETFTGEIWAMSIPQGFLAVLKDIKEWQEKNGGVDSNNMSPYQSESFNNYSYHKPISGTNSGAKSAAVTWQDIYGRKLSRWRKL